MNLANAAKIIRFKPTALRGKVDPNFVPQTDADGRALLEKEMTVRANGVAGGPVPIGRTGTRTLLLGIDFGARHTRLLAEFPGVEQFYLNRRIPSVVAVLKKDDEKMLSPFLYFGEEAERKNNNFQRVRPWRNGEVVEPVFAREFVRHLRGIMQREHSLKTRVVVAVPTTMSSDSRHHFRQALRGIFDEVLFLPRPYLSALGLKRKRGQERSADGDAIRDSLVLDLGAGATEVGRIGRQFPSADEISGVSFGGDHVDLIIAETLRKDYPSLVPDLRQIRTWKDNFGHVGPTESQVVVRIPIDGTEQSIKLSNSLRRGCEVWVSHMVELLKLQLAKSAGGTGVVQDVFVCGGGRQMSGLAPVLTRLLSAAGYDGIHVQIFDEENTSLAAFGALTAARKVREEQWEKFRF
jgi:rod shape-determining protein MreB